jgi:hypothetical protein
MCSLLLVRGHESKSGAFLDRDGVINVDHGYTHCIEDLVFSPTAIEGIMALNNAGYRVLVIRPIRLQIDYVRLDTAY